MTDAQDVDCDQTKRHGDESIRSAGAPRDGAPLDLEYVVSIAADRVWKKLTDRDDLRLKRWGIVVTILGVIGVAAFVAVLDVAVEREVASEETKQRIETILNESIEDLYDEIERQDMLQRLSYLAFSLDFKQGFSAAERDEVLNLMELLSGDNNAIIGSDFLLSLTKILEMFVSTNQLHQVMEIADNYRELIFENEALAEKLPFLLGPRLMYAIDNDIIDQYSRVDDLFRDLRDSTISEDIVSHVKPWSIGLDVLRAEDVQEDREVVRRHISELMYFSTEERAQAFITMFQLQKSDWYQWNETRETDVVTRTFAALFADHDDEIRRLILPDRDGIVQQIADSLGQIDRQMESAFWIWVGDS